MERELVVIANTAHARLLERTGDEVALLELDCLHAQAADDHGPGSTSRGEVPLARPPGRGRAQRLRFDGRIAGAIERQVGVGRYGALELFVPEPFLPDLPGRLSHSTRLRLRRAVELDLTAFDPCERDSRVDLALHASVR